MRVAGPPGHAGAPSRARQAQGTSRDLKQPGNALLQSMLVKSTSKYARLSNQIGPKYAADLFAAGSNPRLRAEVIRKRRDAVDLLNTLAQAKQTYNQMVNPGSVNATVKTRGTGIGGVAKNIPFVRSFTGKDKPLNSIVKEAGREVGIGRPPPSTTTVDGRKVQVGGVDPAALWVLDKTTRPLHAQAGAVNAIVQGRGPGKVASEFGKGWTGKQKTLYSDVLKSAGVKNKAVAGTAGFALDVFADPLTYATFGRSTPARLAAEKAVQQTERSLAKSGYQMSAAERTALRGAERRAAERTDATNKGVGFGFRAFGKRTPLIGVKTTSKISRKVGLSRASTRLRGTTGVQGVLSSLAPDFRPEGVSEAKWTASRQAGRTRRTETAAEQRRTRRMKLAIKKEIPKVADRIRITDAIEAGTIDRLPTKLRETATLVKGEFERLAAREKAVKKLATINDNYVYHVLTPAAQKAAKRRGGIAQNVSARLRKDVRPLAEKRVTDPGKFVDDIAEILDARGMKSANVVADEKYRGRIAELGRPVAAKTSSVGADVTKIKESVRAAERGVREADKIAARGAPKEASGLTRGQEVTRGMLEVQQRRLAEAEGGGSASALEDIAPGEAVYKITRQDGVQKVYPSPGVDRKRLVNKIKRRPGDYRVLPEKIGDKVTEVFAPGTRSAIAAGFDKLQAKAKFVMTQPNPAYHFRNLRGDTFNAWRGGTGPRDFSQAFGAVRRVNAQERAQMQVGGRMKESLRSGGVKINGEEVPYDRLIQEALDNGAIRSGFSAADLSEAGGFGRTGARLNRYSQNREDLARMAQYIGARKRGATPAQASDEVARYLYDYSDLTDFERTFARRAFLFYTFAARNTRSIVGTLLTRPGKLANYEKAREELQRASNLPPGFENKLQDYEKAGVPFANPIAGKYLGKVLYPSDPVTDLNRLSLNPAAQVQQVLQSADFLTKTIVELSMPNGGYSTFFGDVIEDPSAPLKPAPNKLADFLGSLPGGSILQKRLGLQKYKDKRSGKMIWGWPGKIDYVARSIPETNALTSILTDVKNQRGVTREQRIAAWALGLRSGAYNPTDIAINKAYDRQKELTDRRGQLVQLGKWRQPDGRYTQQGWKVSRELNALGKRLTYLKTKRGDKNAKDPSLPTGANASPNAAPYTPKPPGKSAPTGGIKIPGGTSSGSGGIKIPGVASPAAALLSVFGGGKKKVVATIDPFPPDAKPITPRPVQFPTPAPAQRGQDLLKIEGKYGFGKLVTDKPIAPKPGAVKKTAPMFADDAEKKMLPKKGPKGAPKKPKADKRVAGDPYLSKIEKAAKKNGIRPALLYGVWGAENNFSKGGGGENSAGAAGPFQFIKSTADTYGIKDRGNFDQSVKGAAAYLGKLVKQYGEEGALAAYNSGDPTGKAGGAETRDYVPKVLGIANDYPGSKGKSPGAPATAPKGRAPRFLKNPEKKDISKGETPEIARRLSLVGKEIGKPIYVISGYRTPERSVAVGGFADDPHTQGKAIDIGVGGLTRASAGQISDATLKKYGLYRPFGGAAEINHIQLLPGGSAPRGGSSAADTSGGGGYSSGGGGSYSAPPSGGSGGGSSQATAAHGSKATRSPGQIDTSTTAGRQDFSAALLDSLLVPRRSRVKGSLLQEALSRVNSGAYDTAPSSSSAAASTSSAPLPKGRLRATSTYGNDPVTGYKDPSDNNQTSSGMSNDRPLIATMDKGTLGDWYIYRSAAGKYKGRLLGVQRGETGPGAIKDGVDKNAVLVRLTGLKQGNSYPTGLREEFTHYGKKPPRGRQIAPGLILVPG